MHRQIKFGDLVSTYRALWARKGDRLRTLWFHYTAWLFGIYLVGGGTVVLAFANDFDDFGMLLLFFWGCVVWFMAFMVPVGLWGTIKRYQCAESEEESSDPFDMEHILINSPSEQLKDGATNAFRALPVAIALGLATIIGLSLVLLPGVIVAVVWWMAPYYAAAWKTDFTVSFSLAYKTARRNLQTIVLLWLSLIPVTFAVGFVLGFIDGFFLGFMGDLGTIPAAITAFAAQVALSFLVWSFYGSAFTSLADPSSVVTKYGGSLVVGEDAGARRAVERAAELPVERPGGAAGWGMEAAAPASPRAPAAAEGPGARLERLDKLFDKGLLTEEEYVEKREEILATL